MPSSAALDQPSLDARRRHLATGGRGPISGEVLLANPPPPNMPIVHGPCRYPSCNCSSCRAWNAYRRSPTTTAHLAVSKARQRGELGDPEVCEACGVKCVEGGRTSRGGVWHHWSVLPEHHLDVIALCRRCHAHVHRGLLPEPRTGRIYAGWTGGRRKKADPTPPAPNREAKRAARLATQETAHVR